MSSNVTMQLLKGKKPSSAAAKAVSSELDDVEGKPMEEDNTPPEEIVEEVSSDDDVEPVEEFDVAAAAKKLPKMGNEELKSIAEYLGVWDATFKKLTAKEKKEILLPLLAPPLEGAPVPAAKLAKAVLLAKAEVVISGHTGEVIGPDLITDTAHELENLSQDKAIPLVKELMNAADFSEFKLGGVLAKIQSEQWFGEHPNFKTFVEVEFGMNYRKAAYLSSIYNGLVEANVPWVKVSGLGWSKLKELTGVLTSENVDEWVEKASNMNVQALISYVKEMQKPEGAMVQKEVKTVTNKTFKLHDDQKETVEAALDKARTASNTESDTVALEHICIEYLSQTSKAKPKAQTLQQMFKAVIDKNNGNTEAAVEEIFGAFGELFPDVDVNVSMPE